MAFIRIWKGLNFDTPAVSVSQVVAKISTFAFIAQNYILIQDMELSNKGMIKKWHHSKKQHVLKS